MRDLASFGELSHVFPCDYDAAAAERLRFYGFLRTLLDRASDDTIQQTGAN